tara:strand:+ start:374 stop:910 length:537 start_codon:yes stop_codon:yes gene_type:complete
MSVLKDVTSAGVAIAKETGGNLATIATNSAAQATAAKQDTAAAILTTIDADTGNIATSAASLDGKTPALVGGRVPVDGSGVTQPVSGTVAVSSVAGNVAITATTLPLPTGASTSTLQGAGLPTALGGAGGLIIEGVTDGFPVAVQLGSSSNNDVSAELRSINETLRDIRALLAGMASG